MIKLKEKKLKVAVSTWGNAREGVEQRLHNGDHCG